MNDFVFLLVVTILSMVTGPDDKKDIQVEVQHVSTHGSNEGCMHVAQGLWKDMKATGRDVTNYKVGCLRVPVWGGKA